jgi:hypothetical protein
MPDPILILQSVAAAAVSAAAVLLLCGWPWRAPRAGRAAVGGVLGVVVGLIAGCWVLAITPRWPPREDQDRLLLILLPAVVVVEVLAALAGRFRWLFWLPRLAVAAGAAVVLLHGSVYLSDAIEWTPEQRWQILGGLAAALAGTWAVLAWLLRRPAGRAVPLALSVACAGAAITIMLSGYASGGMLGLPLAAAVGGAALASLVLAGAAGVEGVLGVAVVGLFALLVSGRFFGELFTSHAALLFFAPLLCLLFELPYLRRLGPRLRGIGAVLLAAVPVVVALTLAQRNFVADSAGPAASPDEPSIQDYLDYGK